MMRYLPFIIISFVLYALFFYHNQAPDLLSAKPSQHDAMASGKVIPLNFEDETKEKHSFTSTQAGQAEQISTASKALKEAELSEIKKQNTLKINAFHASIKSTPASDGALLKGEFYERDFYLHLPAPPVKAKAPKKKKQKKTTRIIVKQKKAIEQDSVTSALLKQTSSASIIKPNTQSNDNSSDKPKRSFKKAVKPMSVATEKGLQEAIAVSGNRPQYPKKAKVDKLQGSVNIQFIVNMQGKTKEPKIITSSGHKVLDTAVLEFIKNERFMPALKGIEKITSEQQFSFKFSLK